MSSDRTDWLWALSEQAMSSAAWKRASQSIVHLTKEALAKRNVLLFSDLSLEEQSALMDEIEREMLPKDEYYAAYARELDRKVSDSMQQIALKRSSVAGARNSKLQFVISVASEAAAAFLRRWPDRFEILRMISHRGLPPVLRVETWRMQLRTSIVPRGPDFEVRISEDDADIWTRSRLLLRELDIEIDTGGGNLHAMKAVLSHLRATRFQDSKMRIAIDANAAQSASEQQGADGGTEKQGPKQPFVWSPLEYVISPLVAVLGQVANAEGGPAEKSGLDTVMLLEHLQGVVTFTTYDALIDLQTGEPRRQDWGAFVEEVSASLEAADAEFHTLLCTVAASTANQTQKQRHASSLAAQGVSTSNIWRLYEPPTVATGMVTGASFQSASRSPNNGAFLGPLILPLVRRLFVGVVADMATTCYLWDTLLVLGPKILPLLCASYLLALRTTLSVHLSNASYVDALERTLSVSGPRLTLMQLKPVIEQALAPVIQHNIPEAQGYPMGLHAIAQNGIPLSGEGEEVDAEWGEGREDADPIKIKIKRKKLVAVHVASQTGHHVTTITDPERVLSAAHHSWTEPDQDKHDAVAPLIQVHQDQDRGEQKITINYLGSEYELKVQQIHTSRDRISNVVDEMLNDPSNERLVAAVLTHEHQIPSVVARVQGQSLRLAKASGVDRLIWRELKTLFPSLMDDYAKPMLRFQVADRITANSFHVYAPPIDGDTWGAVGTINKILEHVDVDVTESQRKNMAAQLEAYSLMPTRGPVAEPDWEPVGVTLTLNESFQRRIGTAASKEAIQALWRVIQAELAQLLRIPTAALDLFDIAKGSILVDFNINAVKGDHRSPHALYDELASAVSDPASPLHDKPLIRSAVRVHIRGTKHQIHKQRVPGADPETPLPADEHHPSSLPGGAKGASAEEEEDPGLPQTPRQKIREKEKDKEREGGSRPVSARAGHDMTRPGSSLRPATGARAGLDSRGSVRSSKTLSLARASVLSFAAKALSAGWDEKKYFYADEKQKKGPVDFNELVNLFADNRVLPDTYIWYKTIGDKWKKLLDNPALLDALRAAVVASAGSTPLAEGFSVEQEIAARRIQLKWREIQARKREVGHPSAQPAFAPPAPSPRPQAGSFKPSQAPKPASEEPATDQSQQEKKTLKPPSPQKDEEERIAALKNKLDGFYAFKAPESMDKSEGLARAHVTKERLLNLKLKKKYGVDLTNYKDPPPQNQPQQKPATATDRPGFEASRSIRLAMSAVEALFVGSGPERQEIKTMKDNAAAADPTAAAAPAQPPAQPPTQQPPPTQPPSQPPARPQDKSKEAEPTAAAAAGPPPALAMSEEPASFDARRAIETQMEAVEGLFLGTEEEAAAVRQLPPATQELPK